MTTVIALCILLTLFTLTREKKMATETTAVRGLPEDTILRYRVLAAQMVAKTGEPVSMNKLYIQALEEFLQRQKL